MHIGARTHLGPEPVKPIARALTSAFDHACLKSGTVQSPRACAGNGGNIEIIVPEQPVQHTPGKGTMRPATLQGQIDPLFLCHSGTIPFASSALELVRSLRGGTQ
jgi:hypothetical protein